MEILFWLEDKVPDKSVVQYQAGQVIDVHPDGWGWTKAELEHPQWAIVRVPGLLQSDLDALMVPRFDPNVQAKQPGKQDTRVGMRRYRLDIPGIRGRLKKNEVVDLPNRKALVHLIVDDDGT